MEFVTPFIASNGIGYCNFYLDLLVALEKVIGLNMDLKYVRIREENVCYLDLFILVYVSSVETTFLLSSLVV